MYDKIKFLALVIGTAIMLIITLYMFITTIITIIREFTVGEIILGVILMFYICIWGEEHGLLIRR